MSSRMEMLNAGCGTEQEPQKSLLLNTQWAAADGNAVSM